MTVHWAYVVNVIFWFLLLLLVNNKLKSGGPDTFGVGALFVFLVDAILVLAALCCHLSILLIVRAVLHP